MGERLDVLQHRLAGFTTGSNPQLQDLMFADIVCLGQRLAAVATNEQKAVRWDIAATGCRACAACTFPMNDTGRFRLAQPQQVCEQARLICCIELLVDARLLMFMRLPFPLVWTRKPR